MKHSPVITIDGPAGVGKSTLAALLAEELSIPFLDTGAMFRTLALKLGEKASSLSPAELEKEFSSLNFSLINSGKNTRLLCNGEDPGDAIRTEKIGALASTLATNPAIRQLLLNAQRTIATQGTLVTEGRDMGTVVFPDALYKFFLKADPEIRAQRRFLQYQAKGQAADLKALENMIRSRDEQDEKRAVAPLRPAPDALIIDTSHLDIPELLQLMNESIKPELLKSHN